MTEALDIIWSVEASKSTNLNPEKAGNDKA